ncbi:MAG: hypothetical protein IJA01_00350 [Firmicutes bacterium]|nr:hypothetical protein [Bacillota bacterium]
MKQRANRAIVFLTTFVMVVTCFCSFGAEGVFAAEEGSPAALSVYDGDTLVKEYTLDDLKAIAAKEGDKHYKYSGYNRNPSFYTFGDPDNKVTPSYEDVKECIGPTVKGILADAGVSYTSNTSISFDGSGYGVSFIASDLFEGRYYYPNAHNIEGGDPAPESAYAGAQLTEPIIDIYDENPDNAYVETVLRFGQKVPNERNNTFFVKYVANGGKIIVGDEVTEKWEPVTAPVYRSGTVLPETAIEFDTKYMNNKYAAGTVYYTVEYSKGDTAPEGIEPKAGGTIYNYDKYGHSNPPVLEKEGTYTVKVKVTGYGLRDSETTTFTYRVKDIDSPEKIEKLTAARNTYNSIKLSWSKSDEADGYEIRRKDANNSEQIVVASTEETSYIDKELITGLEYEYTVMPYKQLDSGQKVYTSGISAKATPYLTKPTLSSVSRKSYSSIQVKWNKIAGADGYELSRYDAVTKKYSLVKDIKDGSIISLTNTSLKTGRKYTYKVRAYRLLEDGTKVYSSYSSTKAATPYLTKPTVKLTAGKKAVTVKWNKIAGASGYKIYRSTKKSSGYKLVKTIKKGSTVSWKNTKLKKSKRYYYKVKAYRVVNKKNVYSSTSSYKYTRTK